MARTKTRRRVVFVSLAIAIASFVAQWVVLPDTTYDGEHLALVRGLCLAIPIIHTVAVFAAVIATMQKRPEDSNKQHALQLFVAIVAAALWSSIFLSSGYSAFRRNKVISNNDIQAVEQHVIESQRFNVWNDHPARFC